MGSSDRGQRLRRDLADARRPLGGALLPQIPYPERTRTRRYAERLYRSEAMARVRGAAADLLDRVRGTHDPELPPRRLQRAVGGGDYRAVGDLFRELFVELGGLEPEHDVLDVGSGSGRMAFALKDWLSGRYEGFDVMPAAVAWCQDHITRRHPNVRFQVADLRSRRYNPRGSFEATEYRFPFPDDSFDFAFLTSVFTHLPRAAVDNYLSELARVLRPGGRCFATYFLMNDEAMGLMGGRGLFAYEYDGQLVADARVPERTAAFWEADVRALHERHGLPIDSVHYGSWCGRTQHTSFQDITVSVRLA